MKSVKCHKPSVNLADHVRIEVQKKRKMCTFEV